MNKVIVEELIRSLAFFFLFYLLTIIIGSQLYPETSVSPFLIFGIPLILTLITFSFFVRMRENIGQKYSLGRESREYRAIMLLMPISCFFVIISGIRNITDGNSFIGLIWLSLGIVSCVWGILEIRRKS